MATLASQTTPKLTLLVNSKIPGQAVFHTRLKARKTK
jgi:hypothetical protein